MAAIGNEQIGVSVLALSLEAGWNPQVHGAASAGSGDVLWLRYSWSMEGLCRRGDSAPQPLTLKFSFVARKVWVSSHGIGAGIGE